MMVLRAFFDHQRAHRLALPSDLTSFVGAAGGQQLCVETLEIARLRHRHPVPASLSMPPFSCPSLRRAVSQQIADNSRASSLQAADTYRQLYAMQSYEVIRAPFDGIVTARYFDTGTLIAQTTTPAQSRLLSHMSVNATPI